MICPKCKQPGTCIIGDFFTGCGCDKKEAVSEDLRRCFTVMRMDSTAEKIMEEIREYDGFWCIEDLDEAVEVAQVSFYSKSVWSITYVHHDHTIHYVSFTTSNEKVFIRSSDVRSMELIATY